MTEIRSDSSGEALLSEELDYVALRVACGLRDPRLARATKLGSEGSGFTGILNLGVPVLQNLV